MDQALRDLEQAEQSMQAARHESACFAAHQAVEKALKGLNLALGQQPGATPSPGSGRCCRRTIGSRRRPKASKTGCGCWMASLSPPAIPTATRKARRGSITAAQKPDGYGRLQSEQALLHVRAITEWIRVALASCR